MADMTAVPLVLSQTVGSFQFFLPRLAEVRKAGPGDRSMWSDVRVGEVAAVALSVGMGAIMATLTKSPLPLYCGVMIALVLVCVYEYTLRKEWMA